MKIRQIIASDPAVGQKSDMTTGGASEPVAENQNQSTDQMEAGGARPHLPVEEPRSNHRWLAFENLKELWQAANEERAKEALREAELSARQIEAGTRIAVRLDRRAKPPREETTGTIKRIEVTDRETGQKRVLTVFRPFKRGLRSVTMADRSELEGLPNGATVVMKATGAVASIDISKTLPLANMIGEVRKKGGRLVLVARNPLSPIQTLPLPEADASLVGKTVMVDVSSPLSSARHGVVREVMDASDPLKLRYKEIAVEAGIRATFPKDVLTQTNEIARTATFEPRPGVVDLRAKLFVATDNPAVETDSRSKDRDQAFHVETRPGGGHIYYYAIADKRHLIGRDTPLDRYSADKMLTMYLPGFDFPVLPRVLSEDLLSLNADVPRAAVVHQISVDADGKTVPAEYAIYRAIIQSSWDGCYMDQQAHYDGKEVPGLGAPQKEQLDLAHALWLNLEKAAVARGEVEDQHDGNIPAQKVTKQLSVTANALLAATLAQAGAPALNRFHAPAKQEKLDSFARMTRALAQATQDPALAWSPRKTSLSAYLRGLDGDAPCAPALGALAMRAHERAKVSVDEHGHSGLGLKQYGWSTAPMRRHVDMINLEQAVAVFARRTDPTVELPYDEVELKEIADRHNLVEDTIRYVEREVLHVQDAATLARFVGKTVVGTVFGVSPSGVTFACAEPRVRIFVPARFLGDAVGERVDLSQNGVEMVSRSGSLRYRIGDAGIALRIQKVDVEAGRVSALPADLEKSP